MKGFDRYLDFQYQRSGGFLTNLFNAIAVADEDNTDALAKGFPEEVEAYRVWARKGVQAFLEHVSEDCPLRDRFVEDYALYDNTLVMPDPIPYPLVFKHTIEDPAGVSIVGWKVFGKESFEIEFDNPNRDWAEVPADVFYSVINNLLQADHAEMKRRKGYHELVTERGEK